MCVTKVLYFDFLELHRIRGGEQSFKKFVPFSARSGQNRAKIWPQICLTAILYFGPFVLCGQTIGPIGDTGAMLA
jgi:hypothetical protein